MVGAVMVAVVMVAVVMVAAVMVAAAQLRGSAVLRPSRPRIGRRTTDPLRTAGARRAAGGRGNAAELTPTARSWGERRPEGGSASILAVGIIAVLLMAMAGGLAVAQAVRASAQAAAAADQAAVAGARVLQSSPRPAACTAAMRVAALNGAVVTTCTAQGATLVVGVTVPSGLSGIGPARARARAGPVGGSR